MVNAFNLSEQNINIIRDWLVKALAKYEGKPILFDDFPKGLLEKVLFTKVYFNLCEYSYEGLRFFVSDKIAKKIDMSNVSFDNFICERFDFSGYTGVKIDPNRVAHNRKDTIFRCTRFNGVTFTKPFVNCTFSYTDFSDSKGAIINPEKNRFLGANIFNGVTFTKPFGDKEDNKYQQNIMHSDFTGSKNAIIKTSSIKDLEFTILKDAIIDGSLDHCLIKNANFSGAKSMDGKPLTINPNNNRTGENYIDFAYCDFDGITFTKEVSKTNFINIVGANFNGSKNFEVYPSRIWDKDISHCKLSGVKFLENEKLYGPMVGTDFTGSFGAIVSLNDDIDIEDTNFTDVKFSPDISIDRVISIAKKTPSASYSGMSLFEYATKIKEANDAEISKILDSIDIKVKKRELL